LKASGLQISVGGQQAWKTTPAIKTKSIAIAPRSTRTATIMLTHTTTHLRAIMIPAASPARGATFFAC
jgi:hypothetical protein